MTDYKNSDSISIDQNSLRLADKSTRFGNYFVDTIGFLLLLFLHAIILDGLLGVIPEEGSPILGIYFFVLYFFYHALFEYFLRKTPGKLFSRTHVVTVNGLQPTFANILGRNLCRLIPLDNISFLLSKRGWHDEFSNTCVVYDN